VTAVAVVYGINPVLEAIRAGRVRSVKVGSRTDRRLDGAIAEARVAGVRVDRIDSRALDRLAQGGVHQGILAEVEPTPDYTVEALVEAAAPAAPLLVVLDGVEDPQNVGAIARAADAAGAHGIIRQARRAAPLDGAAAKASAGAVAFVRFATVVNIARALEELKSAGVWTIGFAGEASDPYDGVDFTLPSALVVGSEGEGLRRLIRDRCDRLVRIPMAGKVSSLNVSVAAGVALFEAARQRRTNKLK
jgi:23S rRNA (guanosine2251-2'-O)-methyltransferase